MSGWEQWAVIAGPSLVAIIQAVMLLGQLRDKAVLRAAQGTPEMEHVARLDTQLSVIRARGRITLAGWRRWFHLVDASYFVDPYLTEHPTRGTREVDQDPPPPPRLQVRDADERPAPPEVENAAA